MEILPFNETQKFRQIWLWAIVFLAAFGAAIAIVFSLDESNQQINNDVEFTIALSIAVPFVIIALLYFAKLETTINQFGIEVRFVPFLIKRKFWLWNEISKVYIREYAPIMEYGGWGLRYSFRNGRAYNVSGKIGLQIELTNGKKVLIGTQKGEEIQLLLKHMKK